MERYDIWNFAWSPEDTDWINSLDGFHEKIRVCRAPNFGQAQRAGEIASRQFAHFFTKAYDSEAYKDHVFVKVDDDVVHVDVDGFYDLIRTRLAFKEFFLVSADVANSDLRLPDPSLIHDEYLRKLENSRPIEPFVPEVFPNFRRLSVNFVCWLGSDLEAIRQEFSDGVGSNDEWRLCHIIPFQQSRQNLVLRNCAAAHLAFGAQLKHGTFDSEAYLNRYRTIARRGLSSVKRHGQFDPQQVGSLVVPAGLRVRSAIAGRYQTLKRIVKRLRKSF